MFDVKTLRLIKTAEQISERMRGGIIPFACCESEDDVARYLVYDERDAIELDSCRIYIYDIVAAASVGVAARRILSLQEIAGTRFRLVYEADREEYTVQFDLGEGVCMEIDRDGWQLLG